MKKLIPIVIAVLAMVAVPTKATTCPTSSTLSGYLGAGFSCTIGNLTFSNFAFTSSAQGTATLLTATDVMVTTLPTPSGPFSGVPDGFLFSEGLSATGTGSVSDMTIFYTVTSTSASITDLELGFNGAFSGTGFAEVTEQFCLNAATVLNCSNANSGVIEVTNPPAVFNTSTTFGAVTTLSVSKDVQVNSGTSGTAAISSVNNNFSQTVPESASLTLLGLGLLGLALAKRSKLGQLSL
jgi:hypothetical protein